MNLRALASASLQAPPTTPAPPPPPPPACTAARKALHGGGLTLAGPTPARPEHNQRRTAARRGSQSGDAHRGTGEQFAGQRRSGAPGRAGAIGGEPEDG